VNDVPRPDWSADRVGAWLSSIGPMYGGYARAAMAAGLDGRRLCWLAAEAHGGQTAPGRSALTVELGRFGLIGTCAQHTRVIVQHLARVYAVNGEL
jgi:hypothetical protein